MILYHRSYKVDLDNDIINTNIRYHSCMVSYIYHIQFSRCYIIGKHYDIAVAHQYWNLMWYHLLYITCNTGCQISVPLGPSNCDKSDTALKAVPKPLQLGLSSSAWAVWTIDLIFNPGQWSLYLLPSYWFCPMSLLDTPSQGSRQ
jgi:hypothetical protein